MTAAARISSTTHPRQQHHQRRRPQGHRLPLHQCFLHPDRRRANGIASPIFFAANRQAGSGTLVLEKGVLYFTANDQGDQFTLNQVGNKLVAVYNLNDGTGFHTQTFNKSQVKLIANFGGAGNDIFINNTDLPDVQYGQGGNNILMGGFGVFDLEKAGGAAGNSVAIGRSPVFNDLTGAGSTNATTILIANPDADNIFRTNNPADQIFGFVIGKDEFVSPFELISKARSFNVSGTPYTV